MSSEYDQLLQEMQKAYRLWLTIRAGTPCPSFWTRLFSREARVLYAEYCRVLRENEERLAVVPYALFFAQMVATHPGAGAEDKKKGVALVNKAAQLDPGYVAGEMTRACKTSLNNKDLVSLLRQTDCWEQISKGIREG